MLQLLLLLACAPPKDAPADDTATCTETTGTLRVCVWMDELDDAPLSGVKAWISADESGEGGIETVTGDDGCASFDVEAGTWWAWGFDEAQNCRSWPEETTVSACETTTHDTYIYLGCMDG